MTITHSQTAKNRKICIFVHVKYIKNNLCPLRNFSSGLLIIGWPRVVFVFLPSFGWPIFIPSYLSIPSSNLIRYEVLLQNWRQPYRGGIIPFSSGSPSHIYPSLSCAWQGLLFIQYCRWTKITQICIHSVQHNGRLKKKKLFIRQRKFSQRHTYL